jgi:hypothetical protein
MVYLAILVIVVLIYYFYKRSSQKEEFDYRQEDIYNYLLKLSSQFDAFQPLTKKGKFEFIICSTLIYFEQLNQDRDIELQKFLRFVSTNKQDFDIELSNSKLIDFYNNRIDFYSTEINKLRTQSMYINLPIFNAFYYCPLFDKLEIKNQDITKATQFNLIFSQVYKNIQKEAQSNFY